MTLRVAAHQLDLAFAQPRQLGVVVQAVHDLVATAQRGGDIELPAAASAAPGTRRASASACPGRSSAFEGMHA